MFLSVLKVTLESPHIQRSEKATLRLKGVKKFNRPISQRQEN